MRVDVRPLPDACRDHVDGINKALAAGDFEKAFSLAYDYFRARLVHLHRLRRIEDADGFRRQAAHELAYLAGEMHRSYSREEFRSGNPLLPGGDWDPPG